MCRNETMTNKTIHVLGCGILTCAMELIQKLRNALRKKDSHALENYWHTGIIKLVNDNIEAELSMLLSTHSGLLFSGSFLS